MTINNINVEESIDQVKTLIASEKDLSPALKASLEVLLVLVALLSDRFGLNSQEILGVRYLLFTENIF